MTAKELATALDGREYGKVITHQETLAAKEAGLVVVYGYSDDNVELCGAINEEVGAYEGATIRINKGGLMYEPDCETDDCPYYDAARAVCKAIEAIWHDEDGPCWTFETDIPHETFVIFDDGEPFCEGIVFSMDDVKAVLRAQAEAESNTPLTLYELREMDGEPAYITRCDKWVACYGVSDFTGRLCMEMGMGSRIPLHDYGKTWLAYRRKPEAEA